MAKKAKTSTAVTPVPVVPVQAPLSSLPVREDEDFIAEIETMDLSELKDKTYLVSVNREDRNKGLFLCTTVRGPYTFEEMCEEVGHMWETQQHHAKVVICEKDRKKPIKTLDENTVDYIEAHYADIITESMLEGVFDSQKEYTCRAGIKEQDLKEEPKKVAEVKALGEKTDIDDEDEDF